NRANVGRALFAMSFILLLWKEIKDSDSDAGETREESVDFHVSEKRENILVRHSPEKHDGRGKRYRIEYHTAYRPTIPRLSGEAACDEGHYEISSGETNQPAI